MRLLAGTSGFSYKEWKGPFYPPDLAAGEMLRYYAGRLPAVEINNTFYRIPKPEVLARWREQVPASFRFVLKASRRITHQHRLVDADDAVEYFYRVSAELGEKLGAVLFQLPPYLKLDVERLQRFLSLLPQAPRAALEFRHPSWFDEPVFSALRDADAALCIADSGDAERDAPWVATASWGYLRLRRSDYDAASLQDWARRIAGEQWTDTFAFFKHEDEGAGPRMAARMLEVVDSR